MAQNTSSAVMARRVEPPDSLDLYPTPPWATRAIIEHVLKPYGLFNAEDRVWEPASGLLHMVRPLREFYSDVLASDIFDYGMGARLFDFLSLADDLGPKVPPFGPVDWIFSNPPFGPAANPRITRFIEIAADHARRGVAMFGRIQALESEGRFKRIWERFKGQALWAQHVERVPLVKGRYDPEVDTASAYGWFVLDKQRGFECPSPPDLVSIPTVFIPPCRKRLERPGDYLPAEAPAKVGAA